MDEINYLDLKDNLINKKKSFNVEIICFEIKESLMVQSVQFENGVPLFLFKIYETLKFESFHLGVKCYVTTLTKNRFSKIDKWSKFEEVLRFLSTRIVDNKITVLQEQFAAMAPQNVGKPIYSHEIVV